MADGTVIEILQALVETGGSEVLATEDLETEQMASNHDYLSTDGSNLMRSSRVMEEAKLC